MMIPDLLFRSNLPGMLRVYLSSFRKVSDYSPVSDRELAQFQLPG